MNETMLPAEILQEQHGKSKILQDYLESSVNKIMMVMFAIMIFAALFVLVNVFVCFLVIYIKG
ncbi:hypothetical protein NEAUS04_0002 [Nematocida ausubeli]|nr:hypothetical protein NEAUS07_0003 [Nematocida ausubeli]KAI5132798.1 hypothetical protein NEAUS06_0344 [Nematocida ausubeli]KAI5135249.1 hypothetical protein NEAUS07_1085 [Nematocida ausubeli]KAI5147126.1 hypothetical protein NEAUS05_0451 [Nematocida ausubeli]KAI5148115.1 hypothetical protein NEAUS05_1262 [Nematocida ausubeli]